MNEKKLNDLAQDLFKDLKKSQYNLTDDLKKAIQFNRARTVCYSADNCLYDNYPEDEHYIKLIDYKLRNIAVIIDSDSLLITEDEIKQPKVVLPLCKISNINYSYHGNSLDLVFIFDDTYLMNMFFEFIS